MTFRWGDPMPTPDLGKLTCPKCQKGAERHCADDPQTKRPVSANCDLIACETCGYGSKDGRLWHKGK